MMRVSRDSRCSNGFGCHCRLTGGASFETKLSVLFFGAIGYLVKVATGRLLAVALWEEFEL